MKNAGKILAFCIILLVVGCMEDTDESIILPIINERIPGHVVSEEMLDTLRQYIPVYEGTTPPNIGGGYFVSPFSLLYASDGYEGDFHDLQWYVAPLDVWNQTRYSESQSTAEGTGTEAYVIGSGNRFTLFTIDEVVNEPAGWRCSMLTLISGEKSDNGIGNLRYAILMLDKRDEHEVLIAPDSYRIFVDGDGFSPRISK